MHIYDFGSLPASTEGHKELSRGEVRRWLQNKSVEINGVKPSPLDDIELPIKSLVFFPKGNRRTTML